MRLFVLCCAILISCCTATFGEPITVADIQRSNPVSFEKEILPIFRRSCLACHSASEANGELVLETPATIRKGGDSGAAVIPGKGAESLLVKLSAHQEESFMPPPDNDVNAPQLTSQELGLIRLWIDQGAVGGSSATSTTPRDWSSIPKNLGPVYAAALSPDGQFVAVSRANRLFIYHAESGKLVGSLEDPSLKPPAAHRDLVQSLAWGSDGSLLVSGGFREAKLWEKPLDARALSFPTKSATTALAFSTDRKWMATAGDDHVIQLWSLETSKRGPKMTGHGDLITALRFTSDGRHLFSASHDKTIRVWNCSEGTQAGLVQVPTPIHAIELLWTTAVPDNDAQPRQMLIAGGVDKVLRTWLVEPDATAQAWSMIEAEELPGHTEAITSLAAISGQTMHVYSASRDGTVRHWDLEKKKQLGQFSHGAPVLAVAVRSDGQRIASVSENNTAKLWDKGGKQIAEMKGDPRLQQHAQRKKQILAAAQQRLAIVKQRLATVEDVLKKRIEAKETSDKEVAAAEKDLAQRKTALDKLNNEPPASEPAAAEDAEKEEKPDDVETMKEAAQKKLQEAMSAQQLATKKQTAAEAAVKQAEESVALVNQLVEHAAARVEEAQARSDLAVKQSSESELPLRSVSFSLDGTRLATAGDFPTVQIWNAETGIAVDALAKQPGSLSPIEFIGNDRLLSSFGTTETVVWELNPAWRLRQTIDSAESDDPIMGRVTSLDIDANDAQLLIGSGLPSRNGELSLFRLEDSACIQHLPDAHSDVVYSARFSPDGTQFISGGADKYVRLWNLTDQDPLKQFEGHSDYVLGVSWKDDATSIATASSDKTIKVWDAETADQLKTISGFGKDVTAVRFVGATNHVVSSCGDGIVRLQDAASGKSIRTFQAGVWLHCVDATADEKLVIAGGDDGRLFIWDGTNGKQLKSILVGE
ncbi:WD domain, G-beta repeat [Bremerella volcania]|uniref:WD domain, G-beta repeat n=1 Tax=Bremerella volcania TaxID=2527984 RepID=A0A518C395_9BACT|nr:c-type cytochrome domain-containing protein [Bremerella volcania]QDU73698.1 WD domain, G-beta repeat [Bremerella volcania]